MVKELISAIKQLIKLKHMCVVMDANATKMSREKNLKKGISLMLCTPHGLNFFFGGNNFCNVVLKKLEIFWG
jgi:hypothetical protein